MFNGWGIVKIVGNDAYLNGEYVHMPPLAGPDGTRHHGAYIDRTVGANMCFMTADSEKKEVAMRWLDYSNEPDNVIQNAYGAFKPAGWTQSEALVPSDTMPGKWLVNSGLRLSDVNPSDWPFSAPIAVSCVLLTSDIHSKYIPVKDSQVAKTEVCDVYRPYLSAYPYKFTVDEIEELSLIQADLLSYIYKIEAQWIAEGFDSGDWNAYLAQLKNLGVARYVELYQTSYDRSK